MSIVLHQFEISPFCQKVAKALKHKGLSYTTVDYNGLAALKAQKVAYTGKLPVLDIDGTRISDSTFIIRHLEQICPNPPLFPADAHLKAQAELWEDWSDELLYWYEVYFRANDDDALNQAVDISMIGRKTFERPLVKLSLKTALKTQLYFQGLGRFSLDVVRAEFLKHLERIELCLSQNGWLVGQHKSIADIAVGTQLAEIVRTSNTMRTSILAHPHIAHWLGQL